MSHNERRSVRPIARLDDGLVADMLMHDYHCIRYTIDSQKVADFETYSRRWMENGIIRRCGGEPLGYFLPKKGYGGADNIAMALIAFESLAAYEDYRAKLVADPEAKENLEFARRSGCILVEDRSWFYCIGEK